LELWRLQRSPDFLALGLDKPLSTWYNTYMKNLIIIALIVVFNDFVCSLLVAIGLLIVKLGHMIGSIPTIF
tara:strand:+ start:334 stop:546 length:213 start_codon:yes stop_codon:yes gene_type:complete